jgi:hypothetical protein
MLAVVVQLTTMTAASADDRAKVLALLDRAIAAHGGASALDRARNLIRRSAGQLSIAGTEVAFAEEFTAELPDRCRLERAAVPGGATLRVVTVINGERGSQSSGGAATALSTLRVRELREECYTQWLLTLVPLRKDPAFILAGLPEIQVNGRPALGLKITRKGHDEVRLYLDKQNALVVRAVRRINDAGRSLDLEETYSEFKKFNGLTMPTRIVRLRDGKKVFEIATAGYRFPARLDESIFTRP